MKWLVDGHNLIPHVPGISLSDPDDEHHLVAWFEPFIRTSGDTVELFFDRAPLGHARTYRQGRLHITYVPAGTTADQAILARLKHLGAQATQYTVVSSDRFIQKNARADRARVISSPAFVDFALARKNAASKGMGNSTPPVEDDIQEWLDLFSPKDIP